MQRGQIRRNMPVRKQRCFSNYHNVISSASFKPVDFEKQIDDKVLQVNFDKMRIGFSFRTDKNNKILFERMLEGVEGDEGDKIYELLQNQTHKIDDLYTFNPNTILKLRYLVRDPEIRRIISAKDITQEGGLSIVKWEGQVRAIIRDGKEYYLVNKIVWDAFLEQESVDQVFDTLSEGTLTSNGMHYVNMEVLILLGDMMGIDNLMFYVQ